MVVRLGCGGRAPVNQSALQVSAAGILFNLVGLVFCIEMGVAGERGCPM